jgi:uncharacterized protein YxjI
MKNLIFGFIATVFIAFNGNAQEEVIANLKIDNLNYKIYDNSTTKSKDGKFLYNLRIGSNFNYSVKDELDTFEFKDGKGNLIKMTKIVYENNFIKFTLTGSNGREIDGVTLIASQPTPSGNRTWIKVAVKALSALADALSTSDCATAINQCVAAGGIPSTTITNGFWGQNCTVVCNPKP